MSSMNLVISVLLAFQYFFFNRQVFCNFLDRNINIPCDNKSTTISAATFNTSFEPTTVFPQMKLLYNRTSHNRRQALYGLVEAIVSPTSCPPDYPSYFEEICPPTSVYSFDDIVSNIVGIVNRTVDEIKKDIEAVMNTTAGQLTWGVGNTIVAVNKTINDIVNDIVNLAKTLSPI
ncbi:hypothetical protein CHUAL_013807 [Chamberlinius hualienensis]